MDPVASFSGLASGVQWQDLIDQIIQVESRPQQILQQRITATQTRSAAWLDFRTKLGTFQKAAAALAEDTALDVFSTAVSGSGFTASASSEASPGSYAIDVRRLATAEKLGSDVFADSTAALGKTGEFWINGVRVAVDASDGLSDVAYSINAANTGTGATHVSASVVRSGAGYQLVLTSQRTGAEGIDLVDGYPGPLDFLGFTDGSASIKHATTAGATSDDFATRSTGVATLLGMTGGASSDVTIAGQTFTLDLSAGLDQLAADINAGVGRDVAAVVSDTVDGETVYRLDLEGTTDFADVGGGVALRALGVLEGGRGAVAQTVTSGAALAVSGGAAATAGTDLTALFIGGSATATQPGDTFTVAGTKPDGSAFTLDLEVVASGGAPTRAGYTGVTTLDDVLTRLNGAGGFDGAATADVAGGRIVVTDAATGASRLGLSIVAHNEGGGALDFGAFGTTAVGRAREIVSGQDAEVVVDGAYATSATNRLADTIPGVSVSLTSVGAGTITVSRDADAVVKDVKAMVDGYNAVAGFVTAQFTGGEGSNKPLSGDSTLRSMRGRLLSAMQTVLHTGVAGSWSRLGDLGIAVQKDGTFAFDEARLRGALETDPQALSRLFGDYGAATGAGLSYITAGEATASGTYAVAMTAPATVATLAGTVDLAANGYTGTADTLTITDLGSGKDYSIDLVSGETGAQLLSALQTELATARVHTITSSTPLAADAGGTPASADTTWGQLFQGGADAGVHDGDSITISGRRADGASFYQTLAIADAATQTLGELRDTMQNLVGSDAIVEIDAGGKFAVTAGATGSSLLELTLSSDNAGGGSLQLGTTVATEGRPAAGITAALDPTTGALVLTHGAYGSNAGFSFALTDPTNEGALGLGASATEQRGSDIVGTIGGVVATGSGWTLTGAAGTDTDGLMVKLDGAFAGGSITFSRGVASTLDRALSSLLDTGDGSIQSIIDRLDENVTRMSDRIDDMDARLERRRQDLVRRFTAMEQALALAQSQSSWLAGQITRLSSNQGS